MEINLKYSDGTEQKISNFVVDSWSNNGPKSNPSGFTLATGLPAWYVTNQVGFGHVSPNNTLSIYGYNIPLDNTRTLVSVAIKKVDHNLGNIVFFGATAYNPSPVAAVTGPDGGPFVVTFDASLGKVLSLSGLSPSGVTVGVQVLNEGGGGTPAQQEISFTRDSRLISDTTALSQVLTDPSLLNALPAGNAGDAAHRTREPRRKRQAGQRPGRVERQPRRPARQTHHGQARPRPERPRHQDRSGQRGRRLGRVPAALLVRMDLNKSVTGSYPFGLNLASYGPINVKTGGNINVTVGGTLDLGFGLNLATLTPYVLDTTRAQVFAKTDAGINLTAGVAGFDASLSGNLLLAGAEKEEHKKPGHMLEQVTLQKKPANLASVFVTVNGRVLRQGSSLRGATTDYIVEEPKNAHAFVKFKHKHAGSIVVEYIADGSTAPASITVGLGTSPSASGVNLGPAGARQVTDLFRSPDIFTNTAVGSVLLTEQRKPDTTLTVKVNGATLDASKYDVTLPSGSGGKTRVTFKPGFVPTGASVIEVDYTALVAVSAAIQPSDKNVIGGVPVSQLLTGRNLGSKFYLDINGIAAAHLGARVLETRIPNAVTAAASLNQLTTQVRFDGLKNALENLLSFQNLDLHQIIAGARAFLLKMQDGLMTQTLQQLPLVGTLTDLPDTTGYGFQWMPSVNNVNLIPSTGNKQVIVASVNGVLYFRVFDASGKMIVDTNEANLTTKAAIAALKSQLVPLGNNQPNPSQKAQFITAVNSIVAQIPFIADSLRVLDSLDRTIDEHRRTLAEAAQWLRSQIFAQLGPDGFGILDPKIKKADDLKPYIEADFARFTFLFKLPLAHTDTFHASFDLGLNALAFGFSANAGVTLKLQYHTVLGFGLNKQDGFFIAVNPNATYLPGKILPASTGRSPRCSSRSAPRSTRARRWRRNCSSCT